MRSNKWYNNRFIIPAIVFVINLALKSSNIVILSGLEIVVLYSMRKIMSEFNNSDIILIIFLLLFNDVILYTQIGVCSMIFFVSYIIIALIERVVPSIIKNFPVDISFLLFIVYFALRAVLIGDINLTVVVTNLLVFIIMQIIFTKRPNWKNDIAK